MKEMPKLQETAIEKGDIPFTPNSPVDVDLFAGRARQIEEVSNYLAQAAAGRQQNVFVIGERGIGKSSFVSVMREVAARKHDMLGIHVHAGGVTALEELARRIIEELIDAARDKPWYRRIADRYAPHIHQVGVMGLKVSFQPPQRDMSAIAQRFPHALGELLERIAENQSGAVIALDDINGLAETDAFARWYKSAADTIATNFGHYPALIMLSGVPERRDQLARSELSLMRVFRHIELERLADDEVRDFFSRAFDRAGMKVSDDAMSLMVRFSSGLPIMMQEIGDAIFWADSDKLVDRADADAGIKTAALNIGRKYLEPSVFRALRSPRHLAIIGKIGESAEPTFTRRRVLDRLTAGEAKVFDNLLRRFRQAGIIEPDPEGGRGAYKYTNRIYPLYIYIESQRSQTET